MKELTIEKVLIHSHKNQMISYLKKRPADFYKTVELAVSDKQPYSWRTAWMPWSCMDENDNRIKKYINKIIKVLPKVKDNQLGELLIVLLQMKLNEQQETKLFDFCVDIWMNTSKVPSVRYTAFRLIVKIATKYPGLLKKVELLTQSNYMESLSDTIKKCVVRQVKEMESTIKKT